MMVVRCKKPIEANWIPGPGSGMSSAKIFKWVGRLAFWIASGSQMISGSQRHLVGNKCDQNNSADKLSDITRHLITNKCMKVFLSLFISASLFPFVLLNCTSVQFLFFSSFFKLLSFSKTFRQAMQWCFRWPFCPGFCSPLFGFNFIWFYL